MDQASDSLLINNKYLELVSARAGNHSGVEEGFVHKTGASDAHTTTRAGFQPVLDNPLDITASSLYFEIRCLP
jgi:hypothetical protein